MLLQHGTLLLSVDRAKMSRYLRISPVKRQNTIAMRADDGITAMDEWIEPHNADGSFIEGLNSAMAGAFARRFALQFQPGSLTDKEETLAAELERAIFLQDAWNEKRKNQLDADR